jgi:HAMP domain-containing protein
MINTLKNLVAQVDKGSLKAIIEKEGTKMTVKSLRRALETLVDQAIKRVTL